MATHRHYKASNIQAESGASSYKWVNDPFTDKFPWMDHAGCYTANEKKREARRQLKLNNNNPKGRAANL